MKARENPFCVERVDTIRYRPLSTTFDMLLARLAALRYQAAIVGPEGSGKTTLLEDLQGALDRQGVKTRLLFVNDTSPLTRLRRSRFLSELTADDVVLLDGADTLRRSSWMLFKRSILRRAAGLIITTHQPGWLPTLIDCATTLVLLEQIVTELSPSAPVPVEVLERLYLDHEGNIRHCLRALYDICAREHLELSV